MNRRNRIEIPWRPTESANLPDGCNSQIFSSSAKKPMESILYGVKSIKDELDRWMCENNGKIGITLITTFIAVLVGVFVGRPVMKWLCGFCEGNNGGPDPNDDTAYVAKEVSNACSENESNDDIIDEPVDYDTEHIREVQAFPYLEPRLFALQQQRQLNNIPYIVSRTEELSIVPNGINMQPLHTSSEHLGQHISGFSTNDSRGNTITVTGSEFYNNSSELVYSTAVHRE